MGQVRVGVIGCGWFGNVHLDNLLKLEDVVVIALATGNRERLTKTGEKVEGIALYEDYHNMLEREQLDAVIICVTPERHEDIEQICCEKNISFYVEKPLGISTEKVQEIAELVRTSGIITSVGYQERYNPAIDSIKTMIAEQPVGMADGSWIGTMPGPLWWRTKSRSGGQAVEQTTHIFDMFRYLLGEVKSVYAVGGCNPAFKGMEHDTEDYSTAILIFESGLVGTLHSGSYLTADTIGQVGFRIIQPGRVIKYAWGSRLEIASDKETTTIDISTDSHMQALRTFITAVRNQDSSIIRCSYEDGAKSCLLTLAVNRSLESGEVIEL